MAPKLSFQVNGTGDPLRQGRGELVLTVKDGPKTSSFTIRKTTSPHDAGAILTDVANALGYPYPPGHPSVAESPVRPPAPASWEQLPIPGLVPPGIPPVTVSALSEEESRDALIRQAEKFKQRASFIRDEGMAEQAMAAVPEYREFGDNPTGIAGFSGDSVAGTDISGRTYRPNEYRVKPRHNVDNHED